MKLRIVPASTGVQWARRGLVTFWKQPLVLTGILLLAAVAMLLVAQIPLVEIVVLPLVLMPAFYAGFLLANHQVATGRLDSIGIVWAVLGENRAKRLSLLGLGVMYAASMLLLLALDAWLQGIPLEVLFMGHAATPPPNLGQGSIVVLVLNVLLGLVFWLASGLVQRWGIGAKRSLFFAVAATVKNAAAIGVLFLVIIGVIVCLSLPVLLIMHLIQILPNSLQILIAANLVLALVAALFAMYYQVFDDLFIGDEPASGVSQPY